MCFNVGVYTYVIMNIHLDLHYRKSSSGYRGKVADHLKEDTSTHLDGEIKEEGVNDAETVGEGPSNSEHQDVMHYPVQSITKAIKLF